MVILDIIFIAIMAISMIVGYKQGFFKSIRGISAWVITAVVVYLALTPAANFISGTKIADKVYTSVYTSISAKTVSGDFLPLPEWIAKDTPITDNINNGIERVAEAAAQAVTDKAVKIIAVIGLFIIIRLLLSVLFKMLDGILKLPVLNGINRLFGALFSAISLLFAIYIVFALIALFANPSIYEYINNTVIVKYLFNNNILMAFFLKA